VGRLAPTPSGRLHLGNAVNFVLTWLLVRRAGGRLHLRIDDLDRARLRRAYLDDIFRVIDWLGIDYDSGPTGPDDFLRHHSQLLHLPAYHAVLRRLAQRPGLVVASRRSRVGSLVGGSTASAPLPLDAPGVGWWARVPPGTVVSWADGWADNRTETRPVTPPEMPVSVPLGTEMPEFSLRRKDAVPAYQLASVVDDLRLGTTLVVRGHDLRPSTAAQLWLAAQLPETSAFNASRVRFYHHPLLLDAAGTKLSKSAGGAVPAAPVLGQASGPTQVFQAVAALLGLPTGAAESLAALRGAFVTQGMTKCPTLTDLTQ